MNEWEQYENLADVDRAGNGGLVWGCVYIILLVTCVITGFLLWIN